MVAAAIGKTLTSAPRSGDCIQRVISGESFTGTVLGIAQTEVNPPAAAAAVPVAIVSLCECPGSRRCTCISMSPGATMAAAHVERLLRLAAQLARSGHRRYAAIAQQHVHLVIDTAGRIDHPPALDEQEIPFQCFAPSTMARIAMRVFTPLRTCS